MSHIQKPFIMKCARLFTHWWIIPNKLYCWWYNRGMEKIWHVKNKNDAKEWLNVLYLSDFRILRTMRKSKDSWVSLSDIFQEANNIDNVTNMSHTKRRLSALYNREFVIIKPDFEPHHYALTSKYWMWFNIFKWCLHIIAGVVVVTLSALILQ